jgi:hypothetical protein
MHIQFFFVGMKALWDKNVAKQYCWVMTQVTKQSCCGQSGSNVLEFRFQLDSLALKLSK